MAKPVRLPTARDLDEYRMVTVQITEGDKTFVQRVPAVDAREMILMGVATLDLDPVVKKSEEDKPAMIAVFSRMELGELREYAEQNEVEYLGLNVDELAAKLVEAGVTPQGYGGSE